MSQSVAIFLDFDGVIVDSLEECYIVASKLFKQLRPHSSVSNAHLELFYKYRGIVGPPWGFYILLCLIDDCVQGKAQDIETLFKKRGSELSLDERYTLQDQFFAVRQEVQKDISHWLSLHHLTDFGHSLQNKSLPNVHIVTTKNRKAVEVLLHYFHISIRSIFDNYDYRNFGDKGALIEHIMEEKKIKKAIFVDDSVEHLNTITDSHVIPYFADWGYGKNSDYPIYKGEYLCI